MTFKEFVLSRRLTNNPRGDFIRDVKADAGFPENFTSWEDLESYLNGCRAIPAVSPAAKIVWKQYLVFCTKK